MRTELYWIEGPWPGHLAIAPRPRGGDWLEDEISSWQREGFDTVVSTLTTEENAELDLLREEELIEKSGSDFIAFPIVDRGVPSSAADTLKLVSRLTMELSGGGWVAIHCRQGVGRSALLAACILGLSGVDPSSAFDRITVARGCPVPDTDEQRGWVVRFFRENLGSLKNDGERARTR